MTRISKGLAAAALVAALAGGSLVAVAQPAGPGWGPPGGSGPGASMRGPGGGGMMGGWGGPGSGRSPGGFAFYNPSAQLDAVKAELGIRPDQAAAWDAYAQSVKDAAAKMQEARTNTDFNALRTMSWQEHQAYMAKMWDQRAGVFKTVQAAAEKLLTSLDDKQKAHVLLPGLLGGPGAMGPGMMGRGWGPFAPR